MEDHERHVHLVLEKLRKIKLYAKLEKCVPLTPSPI